MDISILLPGELGPGTVIDAARVAEEQGVDRIWISENFFAAGAFAIAGGVASVTSQVKLGLGTVSPYGRHPAVLAMEAAWLSSVSGGRLALGIAPGPQALVEKMGLHPDRPYSGVKDAISIIRPLLEGKTVHHEGSVFSAMGVALDSVPNSPIDLYLGAGGPRMLELAAVECQGAILSLLVTRSTMKRAIARITAASPKEHRSVVAYMPVAISDDETAAKAEMQSYLAPLISRFWSNHSLKQILVGGGDLDSQRLEAIAVAAKSSGVEASRLVDDATIAALSICGSPNSVRAQLAFLAEIGVTELCVANVRSIDDIASWIPSLSGAIAAEDRC